MIRTRVVATIVLVLAGEMCARAQEPAAAWPASNPPEATPQPASAATTPTAAVAPSATDPTPPPIPLVVPKGLPLQVALDQEVRIREEGQPIHGKLTRPVYAFDRIVIPEGTEVLGRITRIEDVSNTRRTLSALDANFTPDHKLDVQFDELVLADGKHIHVDTLVTPGSGQVLDFVRAKDSEHKNGVKSAAAEKIDEAKQEAKREWDIAMKEVKEPGRMHRLERYILAQLPFHPQYLDPGTSYFAELQEPLDFGTTPMTPKLAASLAKPVAPNSVVHALLVTPLSSGTSQKDDEVEIMLWQPLFDGEDLILPAGSRLKGSVLQVHPAHKPRRDGQLRVIFHRLAPEGKEEQKVDAVPIGVAVARAQHVELDSEGGAQATPPPTRYLSTAIAIGLAAASANSDGDARDGGGAAGNTSDRAAGGAGGFKLIGLTLGLAVHSQPLGMAMGAAGASRSIYVNFLARGTELVFPKHTPMDVNISPYHAGAPAKPAEIPAQPQ